MFRRFQSPKVPTLFPPIEKEKIYFHEHPLKPEGERKIPPERCDFMKPTSESESRFR
jgi:hypothetical protein